MIEPDLERHGDGMWSLHVDGLTVVSRETFAVCSDVAFYISHPSYIEADRDRECAEIAHNWLNARAAVDLRCSCDVMPIHDAGGYLEHRITKHDPRCPIHGGDE